LKGWWLYKYNITTSYYGNYDENFEYNKKG
jgi:hypothetical protein